MIYLKWNIRLQYIFIFNLSDVSDCRMSHEFLNCTLLHKIRTKWKQQFSFWKNRQKMSLGRGYVCPCLSMITHWCLVSYVCVKYVIIDSGNGLSPLRRHGITSTNDDLVPIGPLVTNLNEIQIKTQRTSVTKMHLNMSSAKCRPFCAGLSVLTP